MNELGLLKELLPQAPGLVVAVILAWMFLTYMKTREQAFNTTVKEIHKDNVEARFKTQVALDACTKALTENSMVGTRQTAMIEKMLDRMDRKPT